MVEVTSPNASATLKHYLKSHGIKQRFVAKKMGLSEQVFSAYVNGQHKFNADFAFKVAKVLDISPSIFLAESYRKSVK